MRRSSTKRNDVNPFIVLLLFIAGMVIGVTLYRSVLIYSDMDKDYNFSKGLAAYAVRNHPEIMKDLLIIYDPYCFVNRTLIFPNATIESFTFPACWDRTVCDFNGSYTCVALDIVINKTKVNGTIYCSCNASKVKEWLEKHGG